MRAIWLPLLLCAAACSPDKTNETDTAPIGSDGDADTDADADTDTDTDSDTDVDCTAEVTALSPADGAMDVAIDTTVVATFSAAVTAADIALDNGVSGTVVIADDGLSAVFTASGLLDRSTTYSATASVCDSEMSASFTTVGEAIEDVDLTNRTYDVELDDSSDLTWVAPHLGSTLASQLQTTSILFMVQSADDTEIDLVGAAGFDFNGDVAQYPCTYAIDFASESFASNPAFAAGPVDASLDAGGVAVDIYELAISGRFSDDGSEANDVVITGQIDTRGISESMSIDVCAFASSFGDTCVACPDGEVACLDLEVHDATAPWRDSLVLDPLQDPSTDRACN
jgi:hypothetical protein